jgi:hypothetical protein
MAANVIVYLLALSALIVLILIALRNGNGRQ